MRLAIISDIHSNIFALRSVLEDARAQQVDSILCAGDIFGYYPWARETYATLSQFDVKAVLGNHDRLLLESLHPDGETPSPGASIVHLLARQNGEALDQEALRWVRSLREVLRLELGPWTVKIMHGTPDDRMDGRYYPDNVQPVPWLPGKNEILILGHTHYPLVRQTAGGGVLLNPGSVGQPRDGDPRPCWMLVDTDRFDLVQWWHDLRRVDYDRLQTMALLRELGWDRSVIDALNKRTSGHPAAAQAAGQ